MPLAADDSVAGAGEIMLFGVRVVVDSMRKSVSMNNLSQYEHTTLPDSTTITNNKNDAVTRGGYASADDAVPNNSGRHRKRGIPWTEEEHKLFLMGLQKVGKGDWRGISRNYVKTRSPTQVASHAQKYFLRRSNLSRRRRRSSLFDITTDTVSAIPMEEEQIQHQDNVSHSHPVCPATQAESNNLNVFPVMPVYPTGLGSGAISVQPGNPMEKLSLGRGITEQNKTTEIAFTIPVVQDPRASMVPNIAAPGSSSSVNPPTLSLGLSLSSSRHSTLHDIPCFNNGDSIISVA